MCLISPNDEAAVLSLPAASNGETDFGGLVSKSQKIATLGWDGELRGPCGFSGERSYSPCGFSGTTESMDRTTTLSFGERPGPSDRHR
ncbi:hypothetical protein ACLB2K_047335 [Fragaria x ananassa]